MTVVQSVIRVLTRHETLRRCANCLVETIQVPDPSCRMDRTYDVCMVCGSLEYEDFGLVRPSPIEWYEDGIIALGVNLAKDARQ